MELAQGLAAHGSGDESYRPTYFELYAADKLSQSLRAALSYSLTVLGERRPGALARLLDMEDELFAALSWALESQSLANAEGSFAESLYGLKRVPHPPAGPAPEGRRLSPLQRKASVLVLVYLPYLRAKLDRLYSDLRERAAMEDAALEDAEAEGEGEGDARGGAALPARALAALRRSALRSPGRAFVALYPWAHLAWEGARFAYQLAYLLGRTAYASPELHALGLAVSRVGAGDLARLEGAAAARRRQREAGMRALWWFVPSRVGAWLARGTLALGENARTVLVVAVFGFKLAEWWYAEGEGGMGLHRALPPPPPPPAPPPSAAGLPLPADPALCAVCLGKRRAPTLITGSGYLFCYKCAAGFIRDHGACPVTRLPAAMEHLRRVYVE